MLSENGRQVIVIIVAVVAIFSLMMVTSQNAHYIAEEHAANAVGYATILNDEQKAALLCKTEANPSAGLVWCKEPAPPTVHQKAVIYDSIMILPEYIRSYVETISFLPEEGGGFTAQGMRYERWVKIWGLSTNPSDSKIKLVFIHEMGHRTEAESPNILLPNYRDICFKMDCGNNFPSHIEKPSCFLPPYDYCDFFAPNDPFDPQNPMCERAAIGCGTQGSCDYTCGVEDFSTAFAWYVTKGQAFRARMQVSNSKGFYALQNKYNMLKNDVFYGMEYGLSQQAQPTSPAPIQ